MRRLLIIFLVILCLPVSAESIKSFPAPGGLDANEDYKAKSITLSEKVEAAWAQINGDIYASGSAIIDGDIDLGGELTNNAGFVADNADIKVGVQRTTNGNIMIYGRETGQDLGGKIQIEPADSYDYAHYYIQTYLDDLYIGSNGDHDFIFNHNGQMRIGIEDADALSYVALQVRNGFAVGEDATQQGRMYLMGGTTDANGGWLELWKGGTYNKYSIRNWNGKLTIGAGNAGDTNRGITIDDGHRVCIGSSTVDTTNGFQVHGDSKFYAGDFTKETANGGIVAIRTVSLLHNNSTSIQTILGLDDDPLGKLTVSIDDNFVSVGDVILQGDSDAVTLGTAVNVATTDTASNTCILSAGSGVYNLKNTWGSTETFTVTYQGRK